MAENRIVGLCANEDGPVVQKSPDRPNSVLSPPGLASIIIPCCGMLEYTKLLLPSLLRHTRPPIELIFLDIGSLDGTADYLAGVQAVANEIKLRVEIVRTETDLGITEACTEAIIQAHGEYLVLLNNDTIVTEGWLHQLISLASQAPTLGLTGPMSNYAAPPQLVETVPYRIGPRTRRTTHARFSLTESLIDVDAVHAFARDFRSNHAGKYVHADTLGGFCLLLKRQVLDDIGLHNLRKWTDLSLFDSDILSVKAREAGFKLACCRDVFVHHFGTRTFSHGAPSPPDKSKGVAVS